MKYLYADMINGISLIEENEIEIAVDVCHDMTDVRVYLKDMGLDDGDTFERVLQIPDDLLDDIDAEYGVRTIG